MVRQWGGAGLMRRALLTGSRKPLATFTIWFAAGDGSTAPFVVPADVTQLFAECWGSGGAGGGQVSNSNAGGGGGGGSFASGPVTVVPGDTLYGYIAKVTPVNGDPEATRYPAAANNSTVANQVSAASGRAGAAPTPPYTMRGNGGAGGLTSDIGGTKGTVKYGGGAGGGGGATSGGSPGGGGGGGAGTGANGTAGGATGFAGYGGEDHGGRGGDGTAQRPDAETGVNGNFGGGGGGQRATSSSYKGSGRHGAIRITYSTRIY